MDGLSAIAGNLTPDTFAELWINLRNEKRLLDEASSRYRTHRKRMEKAGVDLKALALLEQLHKLDDDVASTRVRSMLKLAAWLQMPIGTQPNLFEEVADAPGKKMTEALSLQQIREEGYAAGRRADDRDENPHDNGSEAAVEWFKGWDEGQRANGAAMAAGEPPRPNKPRRTGGGRGVGRGRGGSANRLTI